ncbi:glycoside hydrolase family 55 [Metarhizium album ARSEF 1941]|uniref:Glycoside hydrolase family 55 n=1 Tax=Metarhizium album (strain ARSEF 1941) TaxID=1081103 RepID=A0A0B2WV67_METAS|nr:glycoside hydrolase family 55 [Metarhizium album ARSEF 1941]KHN96785.1 glycoside hydrolase family 55 [Metarhizium album ARSEF 1941]
MLSPSYFLSVILAYEEILISVITTPDAMVHLTAAVASLLAGIASAGPAMTDQSNRGIRNISSKVAAAGTNFWYAGMDHAGNARGYAPDLGNDFSYDIFKSVNAGDGGAIQDAIDSNNGKQRRSNWWASQPRVVFLPPGTYEVGSQIQMRVGTVLMGDATNPPTIKASRNWRGERSLVNGLDPRTEELPHDGKLHGELSFTVALKNLILDTTEIDGSSNFNAVNWRVAQGAHMQNIKIIMPTSGHDGGHTGIFVGQGSSLGVSDVRVERGWNGIWHQAHQQMAYKNIEFFQNTRGMQISGGNVVTITSSTFDTVYQAVTHDGGSPWVAMVDCKSINSGVSFSTTQYPSLLIDNLESDNDGTVVEWHNEQVLSSARHVDQFTYANTYGQRPVYGPNKDGSSKRPAALVRADKYPSIVAPNYADKTTSDFVNVKDPRQNGGHKVLGDHTIDESAALNQILKDAAQQGKIAYFPFGKYRVDSTLFVPPGSRIIGEAGSFFSDEANPEPVVQVGNEGDVGVAHIQDMRITVADRLPGAILTQVNMAGNVPGDVAIWNSMITVGGTAGSDGINNHCYDSNNECKGALVGLHLGKSSSAYVENTWVWVADHNSEGGGGCAIAAKGGVLVQATRGTWLHALGSEHWWLYQLNLWEASNVFVSMLQAETNYNQGSNAPQVPPAPWKADVQGWNDPDFSWCGGGDKICRKGYSNYITGGSGIRHYASAAWDFFSGPGFQGCDDPWRCSNVMHWISRQPSDAQMFGVCSKSAANVLREANGNLIPARPDFTGGWPGQGSDLGVYRS